MTSTGLLNIGRLSKLRNLELNGVFFSINAAVLNRLKDCTELRKLELGDKDSGPDYTIPAEEITRLVRLHTFTPTAMDL